ncbi:MAG: PKD domain-containing protein [Candidatus Hydrogenedens sp.]|nr:PKD domain-containing protein [Candidatus Hydrogenedens sp.]
MHQGFKGLRGAAMLLLCTALAGILSGCPTANVGLALLPSPQQLDFGTGSTTITLSVKTNFSTSTPEPLVIKASDPWIVVARCTDPAENCLSGSLTEMTLVSISVDRTKTAAGTNRGSVRLECGGATPVIVPVIAEDILQADFELSRRQVGVGEAVNFSNTSVGTAQSGPITAYLWNFGDGTTSTQRTPSHVYGRPGVYDVTLTVTAANGTETIVREDFVVVGDPQPAPDFSGTPREIFVGDVVAFTDKTATDAGRVISRLWDFGDGKTSTALNPTHRYDSPGLKTVALTVSTEFATASGSKPGYVLVKRKVPPVAAIAVSTVNPLVGEAIQFNDASEPGTKPASAWIWDFGDGTVSTKQNPTHVYSRAGTYTVKLTVSTPHGSDSTTISLSLNFQAPSVNFEALNVNPSTCSDPIACPEAVQFVDRTNPGSGTIVSWAWDFGDGGTSNQRNPKHGYKAVGTYTVSLTVKTTAPQNNLGTETKQNYIVAVNPPRPGFRIGQRSPFTSSPVSFINETLIGTETDVSYAWDFDGLDTTTTDRSTDVNPTYQYTQAGTYNARLTVSTATRSEVFSMPVIVDGVTTPKFTAAPRAATTATIVQFTDTTEAGRSGAGSGNVPISAYRWEFGDGTIATTRNPTHQYQEPGTYNVKLTVTYKHSGSGDTFTANKVETGFITVTFPTPPTADFSITNSDCIFTGDTVNFAAVTAPEIDSYEWNFGDPGSPNNTDSASSPSHTYSGPGVYTVTLTVTDLDLRAPFNTDTTQFDLVVADFTDLDMYVRTPDPRFTFNQVGNSIPITIGLTTAGTAFNLYMVSGTWRTNADITVGAGIQDYIAWKHNLTIFEPVNRTEDTALLFVSGGSRTDDPPTEADLRDLSLAEIAVATASPMVILDDVPAQPIDFIGDTGGAKVEDAIIAWSFNKYLTDFRAGRPVYPAAAEPWPVVQTMARAAVRAMDVAQAFSASQGNRIEDFVVTGASKRGWTTWLTGITDCRVKAMVPIVIDVLNMDQNLAHHKAVYRTQPTGTSGGFSTAVQDYTDLGVFDRLVPDANGNLPADALGLLAQVDPYEYRNRVIIPKYLINASGDEFFPSDSSQYYLDDLLGETNISYIPNVGHSLGNDAADPFNEDSASFMLASWYLAILQDVPRPSISSAFPDDNTIVVSLDNPAAGTPTVRLWSITNPTHRDFRKAITDSLGRSWTSTQLARQDDGTYIGTVNTPVSGWTAFYIQVRFPNPVIPAVIVPDAPTPEFVFSTPIRVVPDVLP